MTCSGATLRTRQPPARAGAVLGAADDDLDVVPALPQRVGEPEVGAPEAGAALEPTGLDARGIGARAVDLRHHQVERTRDAVERELPVNRRGPLPAELDAA